MSPFPPWWGNFPLGFKPLKYKTRLPENLTYQVSSKSDNGFRRYELKIEKSTFPPHSGGPHGDLIPKMHNQTTQGTCIPNFIEIGPVVWEIWPGLTDRLTDTLTFKSETSSVLPLWNKFIDMLMIYDGGNNLLVWTK